MNKRTFPRMALALAFALLTMLSCTLPVSPKPSNSTTASVRLALSPLGRMVLPSTASLSYAVTLDNPSYPSLSATFGPGVEVRFPVVTEGTWDVSVTALSGHVPVATGHLDNKVVSAGDSLTWTVLLSGTQTGTGSYSLAVDFPSGYVLSADLFDTVNVPVTDGVTVTNLNASPPPSDNFKAPRAAHYGLNNYTLSATGIPSGAYRLQLTFKKSNTVAAVYSEAVNVFDGVVSDQWFDATGLPHSQRTFTEKDFASSNALLGNLVIKSGSVVQPLSPTFSSDGYLYFISDSSTVTLTATAGDFGQTLEYQVNGAAFQPLTSGSPSDDIRLGASGTTLRVKVTAFDGGNANIYTLQLPTWRPVGSPSFATAGSGLSMDTYGTSPWMVVTRENMHNDITASAYRFDDQWGQWGSADITEPGTFGAQLAWDNWSNREYAFLGYGYVDGQSLKHVNVMSKVSSGANHWYSMNLDAAVTVGSTFQSVAVSPMATAAGYSNVWVAYQDAGQSGKLTVMKLANADAVYVDSHWEFVGDWTVVGDRGFTLGAASSAALQFDSSGTPWVTYLDASNGNRASAMTFNGTDWVPVGTPGFSSDPLVSLAMHLDRNSGKIAVVGVSADHHARAYQYDPATGSGWTLLGATTNLTGSLVGPEPAVSFDRKGQVWLAYRDDSVAASGGRVSVKRFDGASWQNVDVPADPAATYATHFALSFRNGDGIGVPFLAFSAGQIDDRYKSAYAFKYDFTEVAQSSLTSSLPWKSFAELSFESSTYTLSIDDPNNNVLDLLPTFTGAGGTWTWTLNGTIDEIWTGSEYYFEPSVPGHYVFTATVVSDGISYSATTTVLVNQLSNQ